MALDEVVLSYDRLQIDSLPGQDANRKEYLQYFPQRNGVSSDPRPTFELTTRHSRQVPLNDDQDVPPCTQANVIKPRVLFIDAYDSFSNNIVALLEEQLDVSVEVIKIDATFTNDEFSCFLSSFDAVVVGPGPGDPTNETDTGLMNRFWRLPSQDILPVLGICLGFQSLACANGATIEKLALPCHGMLAEVSHSADSIFSGVKEVKVIRYHSLHINIGHPVQSKVPSLPTPENLWEATTDCPQLRPLAWDLYDKRSGPVLMAIQHTTQPFWALQYHPESICTEPASIQVIRNWWLAAQQWNKSRRPLDRRRRIASGSGVLRNWSSSRPQTLMEKVECQAVGQPIDFVSRRLQDHLSDEATKLDTNIVNSETITAEGLSVIELIQSMQLETSQVVLFDTAAERASTGRYSIIGLVIPDQTVTIQYTAGADQVRTWINGDNETRVDSLARYNNDIWEYLARWMDESKVHKGDCESPFWGGLMGYVPYEVGLGSIHVAPPTANTDDMLFAFIERSIVYDHQEHLIHVQTLLAHDQDFIRRTIAHIKTLLSKSWSPEHQPEPTAIEELTLRHYSMTAHLNVPDEELYCQKVRSCQEFIAQGQSYELCLTAQTTIRIPRHPSLDISWILYKSLRRTNPAPFGVYMRLGSATILSSSPERFLSWDRDGLCQMRPIKGTVQACDGMTQKRAEELLSNPKERAENLMILDLIRHDLHGILGTGNVAVTELMSVERYRTVWQLVSVIEGRFPPPLEHSGDSDQSLRQRKYEQAFHPRNRVIGLDILAGSLPPGSMTGAPKKRSCELLKQLEDNKPRGIYSGVLGYLCVSGSGDFSVVIRTASRWDSSPPSKSKGVPSSNGCRDPSQDGKGPAEAAKLELCEDVWRLGAGGAITALSEPQAEYEEMIGKLKSTLTAFTLPSTHKTSAITTAVSPPTTEDTISVLQSLSCFSSEPSIHVDRTEDMERVWALYLSMVGSQPHSRQLSKEDFLSQTTACQNITDLLHIFATIEEEEVGIVQNLSHTLSQTNATENSHQESFLSNGYASLEPNPAPNGIIKDIQPQSRERDQHQTQTNAKASPISC